MKRMLVPWSLPLLAGALLLTGASLLPAAEIIIDDFNVNEGRYTSIPATGSGSSANIAASSTADRVTTNTPREGAGHQKLVLNATTPGTSMRLRHLSGGGSSANNIDITTSAEEDGWLGVYLKTADASTDPNWTVQIWLEGASINGSIPKTIIADGEWHLYEWNLDDNSGGPDGWGNVTSIATGSPTVSDGNHSIDSVIFRNATGPASSTLYMDFVAKSASGSVSGMLGNPCLNTSGVVVSGPVAATLTNVIVSGVATNATAITVYQNTGASGAMVAIGSQTSGLVGGQNAVPVTGLAKGAVVVATQTVAGQESCVPTAAQGLLVGGGASPRLRVAYSIRETTNTGPVGAVATDLSSTALHFLGTTTLTGGAPAAGVTLYPSNTWQTVTLKYGPETVADVTGAAGETAAGPGYNANDTVALQVYASRAVRGEAIYSAAGFQAADVTSSDVFAVNWTWAPVAGAESYRLLRQVNGAGFNEYLDVTNATSLADANAAWQFGSTVTPTNLPTDPSIRWFPSTGSTNIIPTTWGILESIAFAIDDLTDTGPFDLYIDNLQNGGTVFQDFENAAPGTSDYGFRAPSFSGTTSPNLLTAPSEGMVSGAAADTGSQSFHLAFQWSGTNTSKWLRLTTSGVGNPLVNLAEPISFRVLMLPVGAALPPPPASKVAVSLSNNPTQLKLAWPLNAFTLQESTNLAPSSWQNVTNLPTLLNGRRELVLPPTGGHRFYRLIYP